MAIELSKGQRFDSRGLPEGYDPQKLYEYRYQTVVKDGSPFESFLYKLMPLSVVKSLAFALDPTAQFKVAPSVVTNANRTRHRGTASVLDRRHILGKRYQFNSAQTPNYNGVSLCWSPTQVVQYSAVNVTGDYDIQSQPVLHDYIKDTTERTRLFGSEFGTLELFKGYISCPSRSIRFGLVSNTTIHIGGVSNEPLCGAVGGTVNKLGYDHDYQTVSISRAARLSTSVHDQLRQGEIALSKALCQQNAVSMLKSITPFQRDYTLARNLVELRDVPRSVLQLQQTMTDLHKVYLSLRHSPKARKIIFNLKGLAKDVPNEYLSYHFGWKQLYRDVVDLLSLPEKTSKRVNFLIRRSGKATTLRSKRNFLSGSVGSSGFEYEVLPGESGVSADSRIVREAEVRLVVNCIWDFPPINSPEFKQHVYAERTGIEPRFTDVYNLVPWTWLVDWFTGLGNYIDLVDTMNRDPKLINWGVISCSIKGKLSTDFSSKSTTSSWVSTGGPVVATDTVTVNRHTSFYDYECITRSDVATILDVNLTSVPATLTPFQLSILGALISQRAKFRR